MPPQRSVPWSGRRSCSRGPCGMVDTARGLSPASLISPWLRGPPSPPTLVSPTSSLETQPQKGGAFQSQAPGREAPRQALAGPLLTDHHTRFGGAGQRVRLLPRGGTEAGHRGSRAGKWGIKVIGPRLVLGQVRWECPRWPGLYRCEEVMKFDDLGPLPP